MLVTASSDDQGKWWDTQKVRCGGTGTGTQSLVKTLKLNQTKPIFILYMQAHSTKKKFNILILLMKIWNTNYFKSN